MALIKAHEAPPERPAELSESVEEELNTNIGNGIRKWEPSDNILDEWDSVVFYMKEAGWSCHKSIDRSPIDPEVKTTFITVKKAV